MKRKRTIRFSEYTVAPATKGQKNTCVKNALDNTSPISRGETLAEQVRTQLGYVGPWFWLGLAIILAFLLLAFRWITWQAPTQLETIYPTLALFSISGPAVACLSAPVLVHSHASGMWELEEAAFYNLPRLTALRLLLCTFAALPVMVALAVLGMGTTGLLHGLAGLIAPFLLANGINYSILGRMRGMAGGLCCIGVNLLLAVLCPAMLLWTGAALPLLQRNMPHLLSAFILAACILFFAWSARQYICKSHHERNYNYGNHI